MVAQLIDKIGFNPVDVGTLRRAGGGSRSGRPHAPEDTDSTQ
jgi:predicted dinucleotide-binding enzyme